MTPRNLSLAAIAFIGSIGCTTAHSKTKSLNAEDHHASQRRQASTVKTDEMVRDSRRENSALDDDKTRLTAMDQSNDPKDIKLVAKVRRAVLDDDSLSTYAHNITIVSRKGDVALIGPVRDQHEIDVIDNLAREIAGAGRVTNNLTIEAH